MGHGTQTFVFGAVAPFELRRGALAWDQSLRPCVEWEASVVRLEGRFENYQRFLQ